MEDIEIIAVGVLFAVALSLSERRLPEPARIPLNVGLTLATAGLFYVLGISIASNAIDFIQANLGAVLGVGLVDGWAAEGLV